MTRVRNKIGKPRPPPPQKEAPPTTTVFETTITVATVIRSTECSLNDLWKIIFLNLKINR